MSRESKIIMAKEYSAEKTIYNYESFGWELLSLNGNQITMSRETQNPVYPELLKYQLQYEEKLAELAKITYPQQPQLHAAFDFTTALITYVLFILPGICYTVYKMNHKKQDELAMAAYTQAVAECDAQKAKILAEIDKITNDSRATFFSRH